MAQEVINGLHGNGEARKQSLGSRYQEVQNRVNQLIASKQTSAVYYTIQRGDTLSGIAKKYSTTVSQLVNWNNIVNPNLIYPNQRIRVK